jgi:hypothetical protein
MDTTLIVFYSYTGVSRRLAQLVAAQQGWPIGEVRDARQRAGASGTLRCVLDSLLRRHPKVTYSGPDPGDFRTVVLVSPVWVGSLCGPMRTFLADSRESLHRVAVLCTMGSAGAGAAAGEVARILGQAPVLSAGIRQEEVEGGGCGPQVQAFGDALRPKRAAGPRPPATWSPQAG